MNDTAAQAERASAPTSHLGGWRTPVRGNPALARLAASRRVLLLQGPVGPFFDRLTTWLMERGAEVRRIAFHGGDEFDCRATAPVPFRAPPAEWPAAFAELLQSWRPDCVVLFGQSRYHHKVALERARAIDLPVVVMEEGYFRPGFATMELGGVNGYSTTLDRFSVADESLHEVQQPHACERHFEKMAWHASRHYIALTGSVRKYPAYEHHRSTDLGGYAKYWMTSWARKYWHYAADMRAQRDLLYTGRPYFFVPLQLDGDSQISHHSPFRQTSEFTVKVLTSFAEHAPRSALLVFKQHPHARGGKGNRQLIAQLSEALRIRDRVHHLVEGDTPDLAEHSIGTVVINSTVGLQAIERGCPVLALGTAHYNRVGLSHQGPLDMFWTDPGLLDTSIAQAFLNELKTLTQVPVSLYDDRHRPLVWKVGEQA